MLLAFMSVGLQDRSWYVCRQFHVSICLGQKGVISWYQKYEAFGEIGMPGLLKNTCKVPVNQNKLQELLGTLA